jgi:two-component system response regulator RegX3
VLRRNQSVEQASGAQDDDVALVCGDITMHVGEHQVTVRGQDVFFPLKEFELLEYLMQNKGRVMTRHQLIDRIWGSNYVGDTKTLDVHVKRVRSKIETDPSHPQCLTTVRGLGYKIDDPTK